jgi:hypothetical protein
VYGLLDNPHDDRLIRLRLLHQPIVTPRGP